MIHDFIALASHYFYTMEYTTYVNHPSMALPNMVWLAQNAVNPNCCLPIPLASDPKQLGKVKFGLLACQVSGLMFIIVLDFLSSQVCPKGEHLGLHIGAAQIPEHLPESPITISAVSFSREVT